MYPKLILSLSGSVISEINLDKETITIGRKEKNDVQIDNLSVSGAHAKVLTFGKDCFLEDLGSTNGTYVNGDTITKCVLKHGDKITIGKHELVYENEFAKGDSNEEEDFEKTMILRPYAQGLGGESVAPKEKNVSANTKPQPKKAAAIKSDHAQADFQAALQLLSGANVGKRLSLSKPLTRLGKPGAQVAAIQKRSSGCFVFNVTGAGSAPSVNGHELGAKAVRLNNGDILEIGVVRMKYVQW